MSRESVKEALDQVDGKMQMFGSGLNLLDPNGSFKSTPPSVPSQDLLIEIMQAVRDDYRNLSDAIHALRKEIEHGTT